MAAAPRTTSSGLVIYRLNVKQYLKIIGSGILPGGARVELLGGLILDNRRRSRTPSASGLVPYRLSARQYEAMIIAGVFPEGAHVELLGGLLVDKMSKNPPHSIASGQARDLLATIVPAGWFVDEAKAIEIARRSRPEPDVIVVRGRRHDYRIRPPGPSELAIVIEVSDSTYFKDRGAKWWRYAAARILIYWIVNIPKRQIEVYSDSTGRGRMAAYRACTVYGEDAEVPVMIDGRECGRIAVRDLLI